MSLSRRTKARLGLAGLVVGTGIILSSVPYVRHLGSIPAPEQVRIVSEIDSKIYQATREGIPLSQLVTSEELETRDRIASNPNYRSAKKNYEANISINFLGVLSLMLAGAALGLFSHRLYLNNKAEVKNYAPVNST